MSNLLQFIFRLSKSSKKLALFRKSPLAVSQRAGLTRKEQKAVLSRDPDRIRGAAGSPALRARKETLKRNSSKGSLDVVGTGIMAIVEITSEAEDCIRAADKVLYCVANPVTEEWIQSAGMSAESLSGLYAPNKSRRVTYGEMVQRILHFVRKGLRVCAVFYGHPGFFCFPGHEAIRQARAEGFVARMLPGITAFDCFVADLGIDPGTNGWQSFLADDFLVYSRRFNPRIPLVLWQPSHVGEFRAPSSECNRRSLRILTRELRKHYPANHEVIVYEASQFVVAEPVVQRIRLARLPAARMNPFSMLYVPPRSRARESANDAALVRARRP